MGCFPIKGLFPLGGRRVVTPPLPYDAEVEYLESTGTQYVDTGVHLNGALSFDMRIRALNGSVRPFGADDLLSSNNPRQWIAVSTSRYNWNCSNGSSYNAYVDGSFIGTDCNIQASGNTLTVNGMSGSASGWTIPGEVSSVTIGIFANHRITAQGAESWIVPASMRLYSFEIRNGSTLVRSFHPVRVGSTGYLFDRVSGQLYGNAGTGAFTIGPDINGV